MAILARVTRETRANPSMVVGALILSALIIASILAPFFTGFDPKALSLPERLGAPSRAHWFGTDGFGRDVYSRTLYGGRVSLVVGIAVVLISSAVGITIGTVAGFFRELDGLIMRIVDGFMSIPSILLGISMVALLGASILNVVLALSIAESPRMIRVTRSCALSLRERPFVDAARAIGATNYRIMAAHIGPNLISPMLVMATFVAAQAILLEAYLSFLGAGTPPSIPSWGNIMAESRDVMQRATWTIMFPGLFLATTVLAVNLIGDGLRDTLDPKTARQARAQ